MAHKSKTKPVQKSHYGVNPNIPTVRALPAMPVEIRYDVRETVIEVERHGEDMLFRMKDKTADIGNRAQVFLDVFALRRGFLEVKTAAEALSFLMDSGVFRFRCASEPEGQLLWSDFQLWQLAIRETMCGGPSPEIWDQVWIRRLLV